MEIWVQKVYWEVLWKLLPMGEGRNQDQAKRELNFNVIPTMAFAIPYRNV
jgi:hypothetical protein